MLLNKQLLYSDKFKHSNDGYKFFIGYLHDYDLIRTLCIFLPQISGYIKYFDNDGNNMSFKVCMKVCI